MLLTPHFAPMTLLRKVIFFCFNEEIKEQKRNGTIEFLNELLNIKVV